MLLTKTQQAFIAMIGGNDAILASLVQKTIEEVKGNNPIQSLCKNLWEIVDHIPKQDIRTLFIEENPENWYEEFSPCLCTQIANNGFCIYIEIRSNDEVPNSLDDFRLVILFGEEGIIL
jgi:hypothetical protein